jgi:hypothetical protein
MRETTMQDALLCYYIVANMLHAGYLGVAAKLLQQVRMRCRALLVRPAKAPARSIAEAPALFREMDEWVARLTRMESYVESMA